MKLLDGELEQVAQLARELCGIVLDQSKDYLIEQRLSALADQASCVTFGELCTRIRSRVAPELALSFVDRITTGETRFFRDSHPFAAFQHKVLPEALDRAGGRRTARILSAACSTGQEPSSLAMLAYEMLGEAAVREVEITGVDVSSAALEQARGGVYSEFDLRRSGRAELTSRYLLPADGGWHLDPRVLRLIRYQQHNLLSSLSVLGTFDVIFCRNVAIYFDRPTCEQLMRDLGEALTPGGVLFLGAAEALSLSSPQLEREEHCDAVVYRSTA